MIKNNFNKFLCKEIKKTDKFKLSGAKKIKQLKIAHLETKTIRLDPYSEYTEFNVNINDTVSLTFKIFTNGSYEVY
ncbi:hypothetical protein [Ruminococcus sp. Marseille-P6503]|uniref:hypothetical protein n=1 Tax=Ruminococcus sp. Marseille-P6503 TaxID=2364796 RepID=UPI000F51CBCC|nr:hypothetical protein [Ruminococcus sp. Marseille-P6503]